MSITPYYPRTCPFTPPHFFLFPTPILGRRLPSSLGLFRLSIQWERAKRFVHPAHFTHRAGSLDCRLVESSSR